MPKQIRSKADAFRPAKRSWVCQRCHQPHSKKPVACAICKHIEFYYFQSDKERKRHAALRQREGYKLIEELEVHPKYEFHLPTPTGANLLAFTYTPEFRYYEIDGLDRALIVEDVKGSLNPKHWTAEFKLKMRCMKIRYGIEISVVVG